MLSGVSELDGLATGSFAGIVLDIRNLLQYEKFIQASPFCRMYSHSSLSLYTSLLARFPISSFILFRLDRNR